MKEAKRTCPRCNGRFFWIPRPRDGGAPFWLCDVCRFSEHEDGAEAVHRPTPSPEQRELIYAVYSEAARFCQEMLWNPPSQWREDARAARDLLMKKRGFSDTALRRARIGYHPNSNALFSHLAAKGLTEGAQIAGLFHREGTARNILRNRIIIPYFVGNSDICVLIRGRAANHRFGEAKYLSPSCEMFAGGEPVWYANDVIAKASSVIVTEGEFKALAVNQAYWAGELPCPAIASPGISYLPSKYLDALAGKRVYLIYDSEFRKPKNIFAPPPGGLFTVLNGEKISGLGSENHIDRLQRRLDNCTDDVERGRLEQALERATEEIQARKERGIQAFVVRLPTDLATGKTDLDSYLLAHSPLALKKALESARTFAEWYSQHGPKGYRVDKGGMWYGGRQLANYQAIIAADISKSDGQGVDIEHAFAVKTPSGATRWIRIPATDWADPRRGMERLRAAIGEGAADDEGRDTFKAIKALSHYGGSPQPITSYATTGWELINGSWHFLVPDGCITAEGARNTPFAELPSDALGNHYALTGPGDARAGARAFLRYLQGEVSPQARALILTGSNALAPIHRFTGHYEKPATWASGASGILKTSELRAGVLAVWGPRFTMERGDGAPLPKWESTYNALELTAYTYRDLPIVIDDYKQAVAPPSTVARLLHSYSESSSRARMTRDRKQDRTYPARGIIFITGEDRPTDDSGQTGRIIHLEVGRGSVNPTALEELQHAGYRGDLAAFWRGYIQYLAKQLDKVGAKAFTESLQAKMRADDEALPGHLRTAGALRLNRLGWLVLCEWLLSEGHISESEARDLSTKHAEARRDVANQQKETVATEKPCERFINIIREMLATGEAVIEDAYSSTIADTPHGIVHPRPIIGFALERGGAEGVALFPDKVFELVSERARKTGRPLGYTRAAIFAQIKDENWILAHSDGRLTLKVRHKTGGAINTLVLKRAALLGETEEASPPPPRNGANVPSVPTSRGRSYVNWEHENGGDYQRNGGQSGGSVPSVPSVPSQNATYINSAGSVPPLNGHGHTVPQTVTNGFSPGTVGTAGILAQQQSKICSQCGGNEWEHCSEVGTNGDTLAHASGAVEWEVGEV